MQTLLATDIEASKRLGEDRPSEMTGAHARRDAVLAGSIEAGNGAILKSTGDGLIVGFTPGGDAIAAWLDAKGTLGSAHCGATRPLRVRLGIPSEA